MSRPLLTLLLCAAALGACRDARDTSTRRPTKPVDSGVVVDTGVVGHDAGFIDAGDPFADSGVPPIDSGVPPIDAGAPIDAGTRPDAGPIPGTVTVYDLQNPTRPDHPGMDGRLRLQDVIVTAVITGGSSDGSFWVQDPNGGPYSGILVFRPSSVPAVVQVGDRVSLSGTLTEYFDVTEVVLEALESATPGAPPAPTTVDASQLANGSPNAEQWEGVLVRVAGVTVLDTMPDDPDDFGEYVVTGGLRIDDMIFALDPRPSVGTAYTAIIGVHHHSFENYKIEPRGPGDFVQ